MDERCARFPLLAAMRDRIILFDGAMGTMLHSANLSLDDYEGKENCVDLLNVTRPDVIARIHGEYFAAGSDIVETNTFGAMPMVLTEFGIAERAREISRAGAQVAKQVALDFSTPSRPRWVAGSMGPTTKVVSLGHTSFAEQRDSYRECAIGLLEGGVDAIIIETQLDPLTLKSGIIAARQAMRIVGREVPIIAQVTIETTGTMLAGTDITTVLPILEALDVDVLGLNCATGPDRMVEPVRFLGKNASRFISVQPNAGIPKNVDGHARFDLQPSDLADALERFAREFGTNAVGGCCGTTPTHIRAVAERIAGITPTLHRVRQPTQVASLYSPVPLTQEPAPLIVGERTNATGSKQFRELLLRDDWEGMVEMAKEAVGEGAHLIDVCTAYVGRDERRDMTELLRRISTQVTLPILLDSTQLDVLEAGLELLGGRAVINSVNFEDGQGKADRIFALAKEHGAALVALTIDEQGMAKTADRKLEIAVRLHDRALYHGLTPDCLLFDTLTFPLGSGEEDTRKAGIETLEGISRIKARLPGVRTILGVSNISFGLKPYSRQVLNSVFLAEAIERGLDAAIINAKKILPLADLNPDDVAVTRDLIYDRRRSPESGDGYDPLFAFVARFQDAKASESASADREAEMPLPERLKRRIIDGKKAGIDKLLDEAMLTWKPLEIINTFLLDGMKVVGELFGSGRMQLPFVLQSAETMKAAVAHLEPHMERVQGDSKGVIVLGTVKGDVHDIGKNLVDIILTNNGYTVKNLGIKVPIDQLLEAAELHKADAIGMSGLLVKSTVVMKENLEIMRDRGITIPVICGGAALNRGYVDGQLQDSYTTGEVYYSPDAFTGLHLMEELCGHVKERKITGPGRKRHRQKLAEKDSVAVVAPTYDYAPSDAKPAPHVPTPPFWGSRVVTGEELRLSEIFAYINRRALYRGQWQYRRGRRDEDEYRRFVAEVVDPKFQTWCQRAIDHKLLAPALVYGYFPCNADKNELVVYRPEQGSDVKGSDELLRIRFPRQSDGRRLCIADFFRPVESGQRDVLAMQVVTMGAIATAHSESLFKADRYDDYLHFHGLAVESAEGLAELWHRRVRSELQIAGEDAHTIDQLFHQGYHGSRYSFGYPACPNLEDQRHIFTALDPTRIGLALTEEFELVPEQSTSALIVHHPEARYFNV